MNLTKNNIRLIVLIIVLAFIGQYSWLSRDQDHEIHTDAVDFHEEENGSTHEDEESPSHEEDGEAGQ